ncbi:hypothetical protein HXP45_35145 [Streptomyces actuosus]|uniref:Uncharacterized protein n=1 Tax=Streptomyces griseosporeus TaxID=1910 RepID=A0ABV3KV20_STRGS|nr:hypothetical protein [Streptomyces actuosus]
MAQETAAPAVRELIARRSRQHQLNTTVTLGGDDFTLCAHIRVRWLTDDQVKVALACWTVSTDLARYIGGTPPTEAEHRLHPYGTARPDEEFTARVMDHLARCLHALDAPRPDEDGHLAVTVPVPPTTAETPPVP